MEYPHQFRPRLSHSLLCNDCGRGKYDYEYHSIPAPPQPSSLYLMYERIAQLERQLAVLTGFVRALARDSFGAASADRVLAEMEEASR